MKTPGSKQAAFSLVEVALAIGIAGFALVTIFGLLPVGINSNAGAIEQTGATNVATEILSDMRQVPSAAALAANTTLSSKSPRYGINVASTTANTIYLDGSGTLLTSATAAARYKVAITLVLPSTGQKTATYGSMIISWPAQAVTPLGSVMCLVGLDRN